MRSRTSESERQPRAICIGPMQRIQVCLAKVTLTVKIVAADGVPFSTPAQTTISIVEDDPAGWFRHIRAKESFKRVDDEGATPASIKER